MPRQVTFLLTEVADSAERWDADEAAMASATAQLDAIVRDLVGDHRGTQVKPRGEGDAYFLIFDAPADAVACAVALQRAAPATGLAVRAALHVGEAEPRDGDWYGTTVNRCARLRAAAHGGQTVVSAEVAAAVRRSGLPDGAALRSLGRHRLKDLDEPVEVFGVAVVGLPDDHPPLQSLTRSHGLALPRSSFIGRTADVRRAVSMLRDGGVVAVTGAPGVGTSRFAMEAAAAWWDECDLPVRVIEGPSGPTDVAGRRAHPGELLVIDDGDRVLGTDAVTGPAVVTTRRADGLAEGELLRLTPLDAFDAEHLLRDRLPPDSTLPPGIVEQCDGLPLAIELLARRAATVDGDVLLSRLIADPLAVLGGDRRADPPRHASMRSTLRAAFERLGLHEQVELRRAPPGDPRWVAAGWHEPDGPVPLIAAFLAGADGSP